MTGITKKDKKIQIKLKKENLNWNYAKMFLFLKQKQDRVFPQHKYTESSANMVQVLQIDQASSPASYKNSQYHSSVPFFVYLKKIRERWFHSDWHQYF